MTTTWTIEIDWDRRNFDYTGSEIADYVDVTPLTISARWFLGMRNPYQTTADDSMLKLTLDNTDRRFSPEAVNSIPLDGLVVPFRLVRILSNSGGSDVLHWIGWIESIQPHMDSNGDRTVDITAAGPMQFFKNAETNIAVQENLRTDQVVDTLMQQVMIPPTYDNKAWILGRVGNTELNSAVGATVTLVDSTVYGELDQGKITLAFVADNWVRRGGYADEPDSFDVYRGIWDVTAAERGRFFFKRDGKAVFWNRHHVLAVDPDVSDPVFNTGVQNMQYTYGDLREFKNEIIVTCHPRRVSSSWSELLWELPEEITVASGEKRKLTAKFEDEDGDRVGGKWIYIAAQTFKQEHAPPVTLTPYASSAEIEIDNVDGSVPVTLTQLELRGLKIYDSGRMEAQQKDSVSISEYGRRTMSLNLPAVDNFNDAEYIAAFELERRGQPRGAVKRIDVISHGQDGGDYHAEQLALTIGDRIEIQEEQTAHGDPVPVGYFIVGEAHHLSQGATRFETTWYVEPAPTVLPWKLTADDQTDNGRNRLPDAQGENGTTILTY